MSSRKTKNRNKDLAEVSSEQEHEVQNARSLDKDNNVVSSDKVNVCKSSTNSMDIGKLPPNQKHLIRPSRRDQRLYSSDRSKKKSSLPRTPSEEDCGQLSRRFSRRSKLRHTISTTHPILVHDETADRTPAVCNIRRIRNHDQIRSRQKLTEHDRSDSDSSFHSVESDIFLSLCGTSVSSGIGSLQDLQLTDYKGSEQGGSQPFSSYDSDYSTENETMFGWKNKIDSSRSENIGFYEFKPIPTAKTRSTVTRNVDESIRNSSTSGEEEARVHAENSHLSSGSNSTLNDPSDSSENETSLSNNIVIEREQFTSGSEFEKSGSSSDNGANVTVTNHRVLSLEKCKKNDLRHVNDKDLTTTNSGKIDNGSTEPKSKLKSYIYSVNKPSSRDTTSALEPRQTELFEISINSIPLQAANCVDDTVPIIDDTFVEQILKDIPKKQFFYKMDKKFAQDGYIADVQGYSTNPEQSTSEYKELFSHGKVPPMVVSLGKTAPVMCATETLSCTENGEPSCPKFDISNLTDSDAKLPNAIEKYHGNLLSEITSSSKHNDSYIECGSLYETYSAANINKHVHERVSIPFESIEANDNPGPISVNEEHESITCESIEANDNPEPIPVNEEHVSITCESIEANDNPEPISVNEEHVSITCESIEANDNPEPIPVNKEHVSIICESIEANDNCEPISVNEEHVSIACESIEANDNSEPIPVNEEHVSITYEYIEANDNSEHIPVNEEDVSITCESIEANDNPEPIPANEEHVSITCESIEVNDNPEPISVNKKQISVLCESFKPNYNPEPIYVNEEQISVLCESIKPNDNPEPIPVNKNPISVLCESIKPNYNPEPISVNEEQILVLCESIKLNYTPEPISVNEEQISVLCESIKPNYNPEPISVNEEQILVLCESIKLNFTPEHIPVNEEHVSITCESIEANDNPASIIFDTESANPRQRPKIFEELVSEMNDMFTNNKTLKSSNHMSLCVTPAEDYSSNRHDDHVHGSYFSPESRECDKTQSNGEPFQKSSNQPDSSCRVSGEQLCSISAPLDIELQIDSSFNCSNNKANESQKPKIIIPVLFNKNVLSDNALASSFTKNPKKKVPLPASLLSVSKISDDRSGDNSPDVIIASDNSAITFRCMAKAPSFRATPSVSDTNSTTNQDSELGKLENRLTQNHESEESDISMDKNESLKMETLKLNESPERQEPSDEITSVGNKKLTKSHDPGILRVFRRILCPCMDA